MDMEVVKQFFLEHLPTIISYGLMFIAYILVFIFRTKVNKTRTSMTILYKDESKNVRRDIAKSKEELQTLVDDAVAKQQAAEEALIRAEEHFTETCKIYEKRIARLENSIIAFLGGETNGNKNDTVRTDGSDTGGVDENLGCGTGTGDAQENREESQREPV